MIQALILSRLKQLLLGASVGLALVVPSCTYQYGVGIRCNEGLSNCEIYTGVTDDNKTSGTKE